MSKAKIFSGLFMMFSLLLLAACSQEPSKDGESSAEEEVTVQFLFPWGEDLFNERIGPIDEKLSNINIELINHDTGSTEGLTEKIEELAASNIVPDVIVLGDNNLMDEYVQELVLPLDELITKHEFDLNKINPNLLETIRSMNGDGQLISFPNSNDYTVMYFNREIFDAFGVKYPTDVMTWDETIELAKKLTGERNGIHYRGLDIRGASRFPLEQHAINLTDPKTGEVTITKEPAVKEYFELVENIYNIPGNLPEEDSDALVDFISGNVAMALSSPQFMRWGIADVEKAKNIDFATAPVWSKQSNATAPAKSNYHWIINKYSENQDAAFKVLAEYTAKEIQENMTRAGQEMTILADDNIKSQFGADLDLYEGANIDSIFAVDSGNPPAQISKWNRYVDLKIDDFIRTDKDINTHLREVSEAAAITIKDAEATK